MPWVCHAFSNVLPSSMPNSFSLAFTLSPVEG